MSVHGIWFDLSGKWNMIRFSLKLKLIFFFSGNLYCLNHIPMVHVLFPAAFAQTLVSYIYLFTIHVHTEILCVGGLNLYTKRQNIFMILGIFWIFLLGVFSEVRVRPVFITVRSTQDARYQDTLHTYPVTRRNFGWFRTFIKPRPYYDSSHWNYFRKSSMKEVLK
jgi:hypothetical protein